MTEKRHFRRYKSNNGAFNLSLKGDLLKGNILDYSISGVGALIEGDSKISEGTVLDLDIKEPEIKANGKIVWKKKKNGWLRLGIEKIGPIQGTLKDYRLSDIIIGLQRTQKTGTLEIKSGSAIKKIYIKNGDMVFSASNQKSDYLSDVLLAEGRLKQSQYDHAVDVMKKTGKRLGGILVELGYLKAGELPSAVKHQVELIILGLFGLTEGEFYFNESPLSAEEVITLKLSAANLILKGIKSINDIDYLGSLLPSEDAVLHLSPNPLDLFQDIRLDDFTKKVFSLIDGKRTIKEILAYYPGFDKFEAMKDIDALLSTRIIMDKTEPEEYEPELKDIDILEQAVEIPEDVSRRIEDMFRGHEGLGYYGVLGIKENASNEDIRKAYYRMAKEFHPDRHFYLKEDTEMKYKLNAIFTYITNAYSILTNPKDRDKYNRSLTEKDKKQASNTEIASERYIEGTASLRHGNYSKAVRFFAEATYYDGSQAKYHYHYGLCLSRLGNLKEAEKALRRALEVEPSNSIYLSEIGHVYLGLGFPLRAKGNFEKVLKSQPENQRAKEGMERLKEMP
ncbi:MAG: DnaJ domain-containing protein [Nitrospirae bacterium]|nr:DnaJ domain-containing protein [Nitrospirota bacterium]